MHELLIRDIAATLAPYKIFKVGGKFIVKNNAGDSKASFEDRDKAVQYLRALYVNVKGAPKAAARKPWTGDQKRATNEKADVAHGAFKDAQDAMKHKHKYRPMKGTVHVDFVYGGAGSSNNGGIYGGSPCAECGQSPQSGGHDGDGDGDDSPATGGSSMASLLEGAGGYPCPCGRDFASAESFAAHLGAWAELEDRDGTLEQALAYEEARTFTAAQRKTAASSGAALPDGSFPIQNGGDLRNAIQAFGRASDPAAAKAHIKKRAKALGMSNLLPQDWSHTLESELACLPCDRWFATENALVTHLRSTHR